MTKIIKITTQQVPDFFPILVGKITDQGTTTARQELALMVANLHNLGCDQNTIKILVFHGEFKSWEELVKVNYEPKDYHNLGVSILQARMIFEGISQSLRHKRLRWALIKRVCEQQQQHTTTMVSV